jgi:HEAT repeat protein
MTSRPPRIPSVLLAAAAAAALLAAPPARGESRAEEQVGPLGLLRSAGVVAVATAVAPDPAEAALAVLRLDEVLKGSAKAGDRAVLSGDPATTDLRALPGTRCVAFLLRDAAGRWESCAGALGLVAFPEVPSGDAPEVALFRGLLAAQRADGRIVDPARVRAALVGAAAGLSARLRSGAALDLLREPGLLAGATEDERAGLVRAFDALPGRDRARAHLARVLGRLRVEGTGRRLADALLAPDGEALAEAVGAALADLGDAAAVDLLAARAADPDPRTRRLVAKAFGAAALPAARPTLESLLGAAEPEVRIEAVAGLGRLRSADAAPALLRRLRGVTGGAAAETDAGVRRALAWALAQCDEPGAWKALEDAATGDADPSFRRFCAETLKDPRRPFVK